MHTKLCQTVDRAKQLLDVAHLNGYSCTHNVVARYLAQSMVQKVVKRGRALHQGATGCWCSLPDLDTWVCMC